MFRPLALLGSSLLLTSVAVWAGCHSSKPAAGAGGGTSTTSATTTTLGAGGGGSTCVGPMPDGVCDLVMGEDCDCVDCANTAFCNPGQCTDTMSCDHLDDSCTCPGCAEDIYCGDPTLGNCKDGGACDPFVEGCHCPNCWSYPACQASVAACSGGKPNGICDQGEDCSCVDCQGTPPCVPCNNSGTCDDHEPCDCADCVLTKRCTDLGLCVDDGVCAILLEGCPCNDCKGLKECIPWLTDGGVEGGTDGGLDAGLDASLDGGLDGSLDAGLDSGLDSGDAGG